MILLDSAIFNLGVSSLCYANKQYMLAGINFFSFLVNIVVYCIIYGGS